MSLTKEVFFKQEIISVHSYHSIERTINEMNIMQINSLKDKNFISFMENNFGNLRNNFQTLQIIGYIKKWIYDNISFKDDDFDETLISPRLIIYIKKGDCDDFAMLLKTMLKYLNISVKYILLAKQKNYYTHIANVFVFNNNNYYIDATTKKDNFPKEYLFYKIIG